MGALNTDCLSACNQSRYPEATVPERLKIWELHKQYYLSLVRFYSSDPSVPASVRATMAKWGLCGDEFDETEHWPPQLYVRETRRLVGDRVFTQHSPAEPFDRHIASVGVGAYTMDSHPAERYACRNGSDPNCVGAHPPWLKPGEIETRPFAWSEGNVQQATKPYAIPAWMMMPQRSEVSNLLVAATPSASHIGMSTLRMEPQFMVIGHSAGTAAALFAQNATAGRAVQDVDPAALTAALLREGQILQPPAPAPLAWACEFGAQRCVGVGGSEPGKPHLHRSSSCDGQCKALGPKEWLANAGLWRKVNGSVLEAKSATWLKKSVAQSSDLPAPLKRHVRQGVRCELAEGSAQYAGYYLCSE